MHVFQLNELAFDTTGQCVALLLPPAPAYPSLVAPACACRYLLVGTGRLLWPGSRVGARGVLDIFGNRNFSKPIKSLRVRPLRLAAGPRATPRTPRVVCLCQGHVADIVSVKCDPTGFITARATVLPHDITSRLMPPRA